MSAAPHPFRAALWMSGAIAGFTSMAIAGRKLTGALDTFEILGYRSLIGLIIVLAVVVTQKRHGELRATALPLHLGRNLGHFAAQNLWLFALPLIPLAQLFALEFSYPILVMLGASLFLGEKMTPTRALCAALGFAGVLIVARPFGPTGLSWGLIAAMACALGFAASALFTKKLTQTPKVTITTILFWMTLMQMLFGLICALIDGEARLIRSAQAPWVLIIALGGLGAHFSITKALTLAPASVVIPIDFLRLPLIAVIGIIFYNEPPDIWVFVGGALIFAAIYLNILSEKRRLS